MVKKNSSKPPPEQPRARAGLAAHIRLGLSLIIFGVLFQSHHIEEQASLEVLWRNTEAGYHLVTTAPGGFRFHPEIRCL
jgi:hypothetical protein